MISMGWIWQTTKLLALAVASSYVISTHAIAEDDVIEEAKRIWSVQENTILNGHAYYKVHGNTVWGHTFGFIKPSNNCRKDKLLIQWSTYNEGVDDIEGQDINLTLTTPTETFDIDIPLVAVVKPDMFTGKIAVLSDVLVNKSFFDSLGIEGNLVITINAPDKNPAYFDIPMDNFHLDNLRESRLEAAIRCLNAKDDPQGQYDLVKMLARGDGVHEDLSIVNQWLSKAALNNHPDALTLMGNLLDGRGELEKAYAAYHAAALQDQPYALYKVGLAYYKGILGPKDRVVALDYFLRAANKNNPDSFALLADMYHNGHGVKKDDKESLSWARKSADTGDKKGQYLLGLLLYRGSAGVLDKPLAAEWFFKSADQDYDIAMNAMGQVEHDKKNYSAALSWFKKSADQHNNRKAQRMVGKYYTNAKYVQNDIAQGIKYLEQAANQNSSEAMLDLAILYAGGPLVDQDQMLAAEWVKKSASTGNSSSQLLIAEFLSNGKLVDGENFVEALSWALVSAENGNADAIESVEKLKVKLLDPLIVLAEKLSKTCIESNYKECELAL